MKNREVNLIEDERREEKKGGRGQLFERKCQVKQDGEVYTPGVRFEEEEALMGLAQKGTQTIFENLIWLTSSEAAVYLRLPSVGALRVQICKRRIPFHKLGRSLRFKKSELDRLLESSRSGGY